jgi:C4-type Zn-finger protein
MEDDLIIFDENDNPICEKCNEPMTVYYDSPYTGKDEYVCDLCGYRFDI